MTWSGRPFAWGLWLGAIALCTAVVLPQAAVAGIGNSSCPRGAVAIEPGSSIQEMVDRVGDGGVFCLKNGIHRAQVVRPRQGQRFYGEGRTILDGSRPVTGFTREGRFWVARGPLLRGPRHGECRLTAPTCNLPEALFIDGSPLLRVSSKGSVESGQFYVDYANEGIYFVDDPTNRSVEVTAAVFAFKSAATDVSISNVIVEKYANGAQQGAIHAREGARWTIEHCEVRLNSGTGITIGTGSSVRDCDIHHNGQMGIGGHGRAILIEQNRIWSNNTRGFNPDWEAGGAKIAESDGVTFRGNYVHDNDGPGLWCDIDCRNVLYEGNRVEDNRHIGIFHEISFKAVIRNNMVRHNGSGKRRWFWGADIVVAASQNVDVTDNTLTVAAGACGIMLIDQGRRADDGREYKTRDNTVRANEMTFEGAPCAGGASDTRSSDPNFSIIADGNNRFDGNTYRVPRSSGPHRFVWGRDVTDWDGFRRKGLERNGRFILLDRRAAH
ncbi:MAG: right-handed parallel beta-helix repeat-containing protein [Proteobacteria bacterium]|nr:right-handed parallel beta-helix repeat-containing protein [Pseudomonadota bacterium]